MAKARLRLATATGEPIAQPPRPLADAGTRLWRDVITDHNLHAAGELHQLLIACEALDRAAIADETAERDDADPKTISFCLRSALSYRALASKIINQLTRRRARRSGGQPPAAYPLRTWEDDEP
jgi:hypothetical protein